MIKPQILAVGPFNPENITITVLSSSSRKVDPELEEECRKRWKDTFAKAKADGRVIWDSKSFRIETFTIKNDTLHLDVFEDKFSIINSLTNVYKERDGLDPDCSAKALSVAGIIRTTD